MTPGCPIGSLCLSEGQAPVPQVSYPLQPVAARLSGEKRRVWPSWSKMEDRVVCPMCLRRRKRLDARVTASA